MKMNVLSNKGFTLIELLVVMSIIGVLVMIGYPRLSGLTGKAKQSAAKVELSGLYSMQRAFHMENDTYNINLAGIGFVADGLTLNGGGCVSGVAAGATRYYRVGFDEAEVASAEPDDDVIRRCRAAAGENVSWYEADAVNSTSEGLGDIVGTANRDQFTAQARGVINRDEPADVWTINHNKSLINNP